MSTDIGITLSVEFFQNIFLSNSRGSVSLWQKKKLPEDRDLADLRVAIEKSDFFGIMVIQSVSENRQNQQCHRT